MRVLTFIVAAAIGLILAVGINQADDQPQHEEPGHIY